MHDARLVPGGDPRWEILELDAAGRAAWRGGQPTLETADERYRRWEFTVAMKFSGEPPPGIDAVTFSVRLQLAQSRPPLLLFDRAPVAIDDAGR